MAENGVRSVNRFDLLDDDTPRKPNQSKQKPAKTTTNNNDRRDNRRGGKGQGNRGKGRGGHGQGRNRRDGNEGDNRKRAPRREFDRRSGPNRVRDTNSKNSKFGWGGDGVDEYNKTGEVPADVVEDTPVEADGEKKAEEPAEPEDTSKTYDEYMEEKRKAYVQVDVKLREVSNEDFKGVSKFKKLQKKEAPVAVVSHKKKNKTRNIISLDEFSGPPKQRPQRDNRDNRDNRRGGGRGRGGRGRGRGRGRGNDRPRNDRPRNNRNFNANLNDNQSFPTLG